MNSKTKSSYFFVSFVQTSKLLQMALGCGTSGRELHPTTDDPGSNTVVINLYRTLPGNSP